MKTLENDPQELDRFKRDINLVDYAQQHGYHIKQENKTGKWHHLERDGEHIIVAQKGDRQMYFNPGDDRDNGSVIDFAKTRGGDGNGLNLGQVRQHLREYLNEVPSRSYAEPPNIEKLNALASRPQPQESEEEKRTRLISEVLGVKKELSDRRYLHSRGISDETLDNEAFKGRIFTTKPNEKGFQNTAFPLYNENGLASVEQKNTNYKNLLELPKNGIWVSHPTLGKDTPVERIVISESAIDSLSYHQLKHRQDNKNTMYIATAGTVTERQVELIQRVIDKQQPKEVVLADDRDAGGRKFNINYLNDLNPARPFRAVGGNEAYAEPSRPIQWHATAGKYHTHLKVEFQHDNAQQGAERVKQLTDRVESINANQAGELSIELNIQRSTEKNTIVRLSVAKADTPQLEVISQELYRQREQLRDEKERQPQNFIRVDYPIAKDFNRDLELYAKGLSTQDVHEQASRDEQQRETERTQKLLQKSKEQYAETVDAGSELNHRPVSDKAAATTVPEPPQTVNGNKKTILIRVEERDLGRETHGQAEAVKASLQAAGADVGSIKSASQVNGLKHSEMEVSYRTNHPEIGKISKAVDAIGSQKGNEVIEKIVDRSERKEAANNQQSVDQPFVRQISL